MLLKAEFHVHSSEDRDDGKGIFYDAKELIDEYSRMDYDVLAITHHGTVHFSQELKRYAKDRGILLISGSELYVEGKHVLVYNIKQSDVKDLRTFEQLRNFKKDNDILVIAPHPYFPRSNCLQEKLVENIDIFDAIEVSHFYTRFADYNKKAAKVAKKHRKTLVGTSDAHHVSQFGRTWSVIAGNKTLKGVFGAIRHGLVKVESKPLGVFSFIRISVSVLVRKFILFFSRN